MKQIWLVKADTSLSSHLGEVLPFSRIVRAFSSQEDAYRHCELCFQNLQAFKLRVEQLNWPTRFRWAHEYLKQNPPPCDPKISWGDFSGPSYYVEGPIDLDDGKPATEAE